MSALFLRAAASSRIFVAKFHVREIAKIGFRNYDRIISANRLRIF